MGKCQVETKRTEEISFCDVCPGPMEDRLARSFSCCMCGKDLCRQHAVFDNRDGSDYPPKYCRPCWGIGESYRAREAQARAMFDELMEQIHKEWKAACLSLSASTSTA